MTGTTANIQDAVVNYLIYAGSTNHLPSEEGFFLFDYAVDMNRSNDNSVHYSRFWTESGWSDMSIYQDYAYGSSLHNTNSTT